MKLIFPLFKLYSFFFILIIYCCNSCNCNIWDNLFSNNVSPHFVLPTEATIHLNKTVVIDSTVLKFLSEQETIRHPHYHKSTQSTQTHSTSHSNIYNSNETTKSVNCISIYYSTMINQIKINFNLSVVNGKAFPVGIEILIDLKEG